MKVKFTCFWEDNYSIFNSMKQYAFGRSVWKDMSFVPDESYDRLIILTRPHHQNEKYNPERAITFLTEPPASRNIRKHETSAVLPMYLPLPFWQSFSAKERNYARRKNIPKTELLSSVTSDLSFMEGHAARLQLISLLDRAISEGFDVWGKDHYHSFFKTISCYRGSLVQKYDALWPYQYHLACENSFIKNYFTEKIADPIIAECLCFYDGCENVASFIDERAFIKIDVHNPLSAIEIIIRSIENEEWHNRIPYIIQQKKRLLSLLNPLNIVWMALKGKDIVKECSL